jgi:hypothetical protein
MMADVPGTSPSSTKSFVDVTAPLPGLKDFAARRPWQLRLSAAKRTSMKYRKGGSESDCKEGSQGQMVPMVSLNLVTQVKSIMMR